MIRGSGLEFRGQQPEDEEYFEIAVLDAAGGEPQLVTTVEARQQVMKFHPQAFFWNADGARSSTAIPFAAKKPTDDPKNDLVSVRLDGTDGRRTCASRRWTTSFRLPTGNGSSSRRATTST